MLRMIVQGLTTLAGERYISSIDYARLQLQVLDLVCACDLSWYCHNVCSIHQRRWSGQHVTASMCTLQKAAAQCYTTGLSLQ